MSRTIGHSKTVGGREAAVEPATYRPGVISRH
jgi:hypothetical protein